MIDLYNGDCLEVMDKINKNSIDLIYIDPPFGIKQDEKFNLTPWKKTNYYEKIVYDMFSKILNENDLKFLSFLYPRLKKMRELLSEKGSIYVHIDWHVGHYIKILLDDVFGKENFVNEIVWKKLTSAKSQSNYFSNVKDQILFYKKTFKPLFNEQYLATKEDDNSYPYIEENTGRKWGSFDFTQKGQGEGKFFGNIFLEPPYGKHWIWSQERINQGINEGKIFFTKNGLPRLKKYLDEKKGDYLSDLWTDNRIWEDSEVSPLSANSKERLNYDTQKPEALLERIIKASSNENSIVADFFGGSGTTIAVAKRLGRKGIYCDQNKIAFDIAKKRIENTKVEKSLFE